MPSSSKKQQIAMQLAAAGKSKLGIPKSVGKEYVKADKAKSGRMSKALRTAFSRNERENNMEG